MVIDLYGKDTLTANAFHDMLAGDVKAVIHKATQGQHYVDSQMAPRRARALSVGLPWGTFHFGTSDGQAADQAKFYLDTVKPMVKEMVCLDWEHVRPDGVPDPLDMKHAHAEHFAEEIFKQLGRWPWLYVNYKFLQDEARVPAGSSLLNCPLWLSRYNATLGEVPAPFTKWLMWQFTETGKAPGVVNPCDISRFNGCDPELALKWPF